MAKALPQNRVAKLLAAHKARELLDENKPLITVSSKETVIQGFEKIVKANVLSAPVRNEETGRYEGFLETRDLVQYVVFEAEEEKLEEARGRFEKNEEVDPAMLLRLFNIAARFQQRALDAITPLYMARMHPLFPVRDDDDLLKVAEKLTNPSCHRVPVFNRRNELVGIISQSTVVHFLWQHLREIQPELQKSVEETKCGSSPVIAVKGSASALETFKVMAKYNRSGIAIVDNEGRFLTCTSATDLKLFLANRGTHSRLLRQSILEFMGELRRSELDTKTRSPTITVSSGDSLEKVLGKMHATRIHRIFVANDNQGFRPTAIISITDLLKLVINQKAS